MSPKKTYTAIYERDPDVDAWNVHIVGLDGCQTHGRSLRQAQARIREALALWLEREVEGLAVRDELPKDLADLARQAQQARAEAERAGTEAREQAARAAKALTERGFSRRDAAELLGISHQRVQQLLEAADAAPPAAFSATSSPALHRPAAMPPPLRGPGRSR